MNIDLTKEEIAIIILWAEQAIGGGGLPIEESFITPEETLLLKKLKSYLKRKDDTENK